MADRFDLENDILALHNIADDIDVLAENIMNNDVTTDEIVNALIGLGVMARLKINKSFETFKDALKLDNYREKPQQNTCAQTV